MRRLGIDHEVLVPGEGHKPLVDFELGLRAQIRVTSLFAVRNWDTERLARLVTATQQAASLSHSLIAPVNNITACVGYKLVLGIIKTDNEQ